VHARDREAIAALGRRGVPVSLCTGRMYSGTRAVAELLALDGPVACVDGSQIVEVSSHRALAMHPIVAAAEVVTVLAEFELTSFVFSGDVIYHDALGAELLHYVSSWSQRVEQLALVLDRARWGDDPAVAAVVSVGSEQQILGAHTVLTGALGHSVQATTFEISRPSLEGSWGMVIRAAGVDKGTAVEWLARHHGIETTEIVAVGDWLNDVPMLKAAGRSFAMAQAPERVRAVASDLLEADTWTGGGIAEAAERAGLL
jgi:hydroxymethylpyrimidine pyrophosphatase-like HAD family hydrolase